MTRRPKKGGTPPGVAHVYEGPEVLSTLLARAGSRHSAEEVAELFEEAQEAGEERSTVVPGLFEEEPRFATPDEARRLFGNLFGLWDRIAASRLAPAVPPVGPEEVPAPAEAPLPPLPERGAQSGTAVPADIVEAVWRHLDAASSRELQRRRDRYANVQPDLAAWLDSVQLPESGAMAVADLVFEAWAMFDQAFGDRLEAVSFRELRALEEGAPPLEEEQPALASYVSEQLDLLADEEPAFGAEERGEVENVLAVAIAALAGAVREPS